MNEETKPDPLPEEAALVIPNEGVEETADAGSETPERGQGQEEAVAAEPEQSEGADADTAADAQEVEEVQEEMSTEELNATIEQLCISKANEFRMLGYDQVTGLDIWHCVSSKYKEIPPMHKLVNDILSLRSTKFMNWLIIKAQTE